MDLAPSRNILIVDDDEMIRQCFQAFLAGDPTIFIANNGEAALEIAALHSIDLVLLDIQMPGIDGFETCRRLKASATSNPPQVIMVSASAASKEQARAFELGADDYLVKPVSASELQSRVDLHFRLRDSELATAALRCEVDSNHAALKSQTAERTQQILAVQDVAVFTLAKIAEARDNDTGAHLMRLREYAQLLARDLSKRSVFDGEIDATFLSELYRSSPLHDIGKVGVPDAILLKPGPLTEDEFEVMKQHTTIGGNILHEAVMQLQGGGFLTMATLVARFHHERWDGGGYPAGLKGDEIPLPARIVAVADVFDALTSERPYKHAWSSLEARALIEDEIGKHFDPMVVESFKRSFDGLLVVQRQHVDRNPTVSGAMGLLEQDRAAVG